MVIKILEMALPVLIMLGLGYFCKAKNVFDEKGLLGLKAFISNITLPVVLFNAFLCAEYRYPGIDNNIRCVTLYHFHRTDSSTYLSNTAFNQDNLHVPDMSFREKKPANRFLFCLFQ